jgi:sortase A
MLSAARRYNEELLEKPFRWKMTEQEKAEYESILDISGTGIMGYIEIPTINVSLPIYHGTDEGVLQVAIGHLEGSSLPVGGASTHTVVSGHRGLPSAKLFTDLDKLNQGDRFVIRVLDEVYTYEVDRILIVQPDDISGLSIENGMDYCTLVTCTPYAVNTHRLLVRGHRVENDKEAKEVRVTSDAMQIEPVVVAPIVAAPMLLILFIVMMVTTRKNKSQK